MSLLGLESEIGNDGQIGGWLTLNEFMVSPDGSPRLAVVAMLVDALGGLCSISAADPDWAFTADMSVHLLPTGPMERLRTNLHVRRRGRRTLIIEADLFAEEERPAGSALLTFAIVPKPHHIADVHIDTTPGRRSMNRGSKVDQLQRPYIEELELTFRETGVASIELRPVVTNTVGALHGAVHASLVDETSASLGRALLGGEVVTHDMHLAYLELGLAGPLTATATVLGAACQDRLTTVVEVRDANGALSSHSTAEVTRI